MVTAAVLAAALLLDGGQVAVIAGPPPPAEARPADAPEGSEGDARRVCRLERATGSNMQQRVCRDVPRAGFQSQQTREFLSATQRVQLPGGGISSRPRNSGVGPN